MSANSLHNLLLISPMTKKESIIHCFENMDIRMLDVLLDDSKTYQNTPKDFFVEKLDLAFQEFRDYEDIALTAISGKCNHKDCPNKGCKGFSFVGNTSGLHLDLVFDETDNDYVDIYQCHGFEPAFVSEHRTEAVSLDIKEDESLEFKADVDFLIRSQKCRMACVELKEAGFRECIGPEIYFSWLDKHKELFLSFDVPPQYYRDLNDFYSLYNSLHTLASLIVLDKKACKAYKEYMLLLPGDEGQLLHWLTSYEEFNDLLILFPFPEGHVAKEISNGYFIIKGVMICSVEFENMIKFKGVFDAHYDVMIEKYRFISEADAEKDFINITKPYESLTAHLKNRGMIK